MTVGIRTQQVDSPQQHKKNPISPIPNFNIYIQMLYICYLPLLLMNLS